MFDIATRQKFRFSTPVGQLTVEQLWDLPLKGKEGSANLDNVAKLIARQIKSVENEESFVDEVSAADELLNQKLDVVKHIISVKLKEQKDSKESASKREHNAQIRELIARKKQKDLEDLSVEELEAKLK